jgi:hypothetical protein
MSSGCRSDQRNQGGLELDLVCLGAQLSFNYICLIGSLHLGLCKYRKSVKAATDADVPRSMINPSTTRLFLFQMALVLRRRTTNFS